MSAYDFGIVVTDLVPTEEEASHAIRDVERTTNADAVRRAIDRWYLASWPGSGRQMR
jgi:hypothetical protein